MLCAPKFELLLPCLLMVMPPAAGKENPEPSAHAAERPLAREITENRSLADSTGTLIVHVVGLDGDDGTVRIELTTAENYGTEGNVRFAERPIQDRRARWTLRNVPHGTYAVALYHDQNDNDNLDTNFLGRPQEPYGFSNDARGTMGPPDFEEAAFTLASDSLSLTITAK